MDPLAFLVVISAVLLSSVFGAMIGMAIELDADELRRVNV